MMNDRSEHMKWLTRCQSFYVGLCHDWPRLMHNSVWYPYAYTVCIMYFCVVGDAYKCQTPVQVKGCVCFVCFFFGHVYCRTEIIVATSKKQFFLILEFFWALWSCKTLHFSSSVLYLLVPVSCIYFRKCMYVLDLYFVLFLLIIKFTYVHCSVLYLEFCCVLVLGLWVSCTGILSDFIAWKIGPTYLRLFFYSQGFCKPGRVHRYYW